MEFLAAYATDIGTTKKTNQDSLTLKVADTALFGKVCFAVVCDGMGGLAKGELASKTIVQAFEKWFYTDFPMLVQTGVEENTLREQWNQIIQEKNQKILAYGKQSGVNMGTTVTALLIYADKYYIVHVGDCRAYEMTEQYMRQLTTDQTLVAQEVSRGVLTPEQALADPRRNVLLQCVGASAKVVPDFVSGAAQANSVYLLCSDGFRHEITDQEIFSAFYPPHMVQKETMQYAAQYMVEVNKQRNEADNITVVLIKTF